MHAYIHTCIHTHTHTHTYIHTHTHTHTHRYIHTYTHTYKHTYIHTHTYISGLDSQEAWHAAAEIVPGAGRADLSSDGVVHVLWDAVLLEVEEETGIPRATLSEPRLLGFSRRVENHRTCVSCVGV